MSDYGTLSYHLPWQVTIIFCWSHLQHLLIHSPIKQ